MSEGVRGRPASSQTVDLYRLLHEADHPMTLDEIAAEVGGMPSAYRTAANIAYREHLPQLNRHGLPVKDTEPWTDADRDAAWRWWLGELVNSCRIKGLVIVTAQDGSDPNGKPRSKLAYTANRDHPPVTWAWGIGRRTAYWTPEIAATASNYIQLGYQRLLSFEVGGGGFDWFGRGPANVVLTAYGLMEFADMAKVYGDYYSKEP